MISSDEPKLLSNFCFLESATHSPYSHVSDPIPLLLIDTQIRLRLYSFPCRTEAKFF